VEKIAEQVQVLLTAVGVGYGEVHVCVLQK
jgi:hypothetical protein